MRAQVAGVFGEDLGLGLVAAHVVAERGPDGGLLHFGAVMQADGERVGDAAPGRVVVGLGEGGVFDAGDALPEGLDLLRGGGLGVVQVVAGFQPVEDEDGGDHVL